MSSRIKEVIAGAASFLSNREEKIIIGKKDILSILPHRDRMLLLDEVTITDERVIGRFEVTEDVCQGHEFDGRLIFRGVDIVEMAALTFGRLGFSLS